MAGLQIAAALVFPLAIALPGAQQANADEKLTAKPRTEVTFSVAGAAPKAAALFEIAKVSKNGTTVKTPKGMTLDAKTGRFSWTPTESQAGEYTLEFTITEPPPRLRSTATRRIVVQPGEITTDRGEIGKLLRAWYAEGTAAGNTGDFYDNRDRGHSRMNTARFPQLDKVVYPPEALQRRLDWALQRFFLYPHVTIGNSSTSAGPTSGGSNSRRAVMFAQLAAVVQRQYRSGHVYVYPEHRDHDPGHNGRGGYGDLFCANVPYLITSQGSSGSDRVFLDAVAHALAAFRPEVKQRLIRAGLLMPTVQMILRACAKNVGGPKDYLTGKAHPTVFEGANVDPLAMVKMAHGIRFDNVPPMAQLSVVEEDEATPGVDYFDAGRGEKLFDTPSAIARIARSTKYRRRMVVSAANSEDLNGRPLAYHWVVLRGDPERIKITPLNKEGSRVELLVAHHEPRPVLPGSALTSPRVDIGAFVHNGEYYSAPAFVCYYWLPDEARTYDADGRILEVAYDYGDSTIGYPTDNLRDGRYDLSDWKGYLDLASGDAKGLAAELLRKRLPKSAAGEMRAAAAEFAKAVAVEAGPKEASEQAEAARKKARTAEDDARKAVAAAAKKTDKDAVKQAQQKLDAASEARKAADKEANDAKKRLQDAQKTANAILTEKRKALGGASIRAWLEAALNAAKDDVCFYPDNAKEIDRLADAADPARKRAFAAARDGVVAEGILKADGKGGYGLQPRIAGSAPPAERLSTHQRNRLQWLNIAIGRELLYPGMLNVQYRRNFVSRYLATPKPWRDVYHYTADGRLIGWTRYAKGKTDQFTADGALVTKTDKLGRPVEARKVQYIADRDPRGRPGELKYAPLPGTIRYTYASTTDPIGRAVKAP